MGRKRISNTKRKSQRKEVYKKLLKEGDFISLKCRNSECNRIVNNCHPDTISVLCPICTCMLVPIENNIGKQGKGGYLRGWKLMKEFVHQDGTVYYFGIEQPELKGTITPTDVKAIKEKQKKDRIEKKKLKEIREKKKEEKLLKQYQKGQKERAKKIKDVQNKIKTLKESAV